MGVDLVEAQRRNGGRAAVAARAPVARPAARGSGAGAIPAGASFGIAVDLTAFDLTIDQMAEACEQSARPAAQAGAQVLCAPKRGAEMRGVVVWHSGSALVLDADGARVIVRDCPRARIHVLSKARRDGIR